VLLWLTRPEETLTLLLSGIAIGALAGAVTTLLLSLGMERWDLGIKVMQWLLGNFEGRSWAHLGWALAPMGIAAGVVAWLRLDLDALQLGETTAASLGVGLFRVQLLAMFAVALLVGSATALVGVLGFVGLVVPHVARLWVGSSHGRLIPMSALLGALLVLGVDVFTRTITDRAIAPGVVTSLLGAPFFLWLLQRRAREVP
jgi:iron complex transport system permease protein